MSDNQVIPHQTSQDHSVTKMFGIQESDEIHPTTAKNLGEVMSLTENEGPQFLRELFQSFDSQMDFTDDSNVKIQRFLGFLREGHFKGSIRDFAKSSGMLTKRELEMKARESGDWKQFIKRTSVNTLSRGRFA